MASTYTIEQVLAALKPADAAKLTADDKTAITTLLKQRSEIDSAESGRLSGNTKAINKVIGMRTATKDNINGAAITFSGKGGKTAKDPATPEAVAKLKAERKTIPNWNPGKKAALTREIQRMENELAKAAANKK